MSHNKKKRGKKKKQKFINTDNPCLFKGAIITISIWVFIMCWEVLYILITFCPCNNLIRQICYLYFVWWIGGLSQCFSQCGPQTSSIVWELVQNADSSAQHQTYQIGNSEDELRKLCFNKPSRWSWWMLVSGPLAEAQVYTAAQVKAKIITKDV